ncbi:hypothetical protein BP00DRAFT_426617 [Aspergillus indologenus CBS 114.80]|uniref:Uncharacterized protein n=1 Tax=Aspergillus indologenus CBS 114.80 TaxID=1450541 RepID=A0A2V5I0Q6_9EURO|nr:hypothetical protein BP00DRAFT_426617 [Aspergillus indologenus CBS 114.80]
MYLSQFSNHRSMCTPVCGCFVCTFLYLATHCWSGRKIDSACLMTMTGWGRTVAVTFVYLSTVTIGFRSARCEPPFTNLGTVPESRTGQIQGSVKWEYRADNKNQESEKEKEKEK